MNTKRTKIVKTVFAHLLVWIVVLLIPFFLTARSSGEATGLFGLFANMNRGFYISYLYRALILAVVFYVNYLWLIDRFLFRKQWAAYVLINVALIVALANLESHLVSELFPAPPKRGGGGGRPPHPNFRTMEIVRQFGNYLFHFLAVGVSVAFKSTVRWYRDSIKLEQARNEQLEADLKTLRNQLNPHFLFNTLNNIYSLIAVDPAKAQDSVHRLSALLRYVLYSDEHKYVPIDKELDFTQSYIELMQLRVGPNMKIHVQIEDRGSTEPVAPLLFMTLIENAFKHGGDSGGNCFIDINIVVTPGKGALCTVENSIGDGGQDMESANKGIGLANLSRRLELLYPGRYELRTEARFETFFAFLRIDFSGKQH